jgi:hypothetical protein
VSNERGSGRGNEVVTGVKRIKVCYLCMWGDSMKKHTKYILKEGRREGVKGL